ncbi:sigma-70 family RNA polymerase sigma factor [Flavitalea sp. BT771]|uniref:RNA polymerase sigma factor n=1 Tax=Flavitalea sp. BT771 TaxID=3063329 RepID=UPI0026E1E78A|nr:sigma-70 family RNA polymerase sigma factor [Flavitalea sp. BT771]MDO6433094.1 sigma-70 family RNA polymerase sigma factor [Flavitalea sp. BT771]MDV6221630.1 sigma-70 family RNA polymerase sigma factor [Flavitalea sp. BT771]
MLPAFDTIYHEYKSKIYLYCRRQLEKEDAEDATAEAFFALWKNKKKLISNEHVKNFLYLVARQKVSALNKENKRKAVFFVGDALSDIADEEIAIKENEQLEDLLVQMLLCKADMLPTQCREAFTYYLANKSAAETSAMMGISVKAVYFHWAAAKERIRASLHNNEVLPEEAPSKLRLSI